LADARERRRIETVDRSHRRPALPRATNRTGPLSGSGRACTCPYPRAGSGATPGPNCSTRPAGHRRSRRPDHRPQPARHRPAVEHRAARPARQVRPPTGPDAVATPHAPTSSVDRG